MDSLEERIIKAEEEYQKVLEWALEEEDKVDEMLKATGRLQMGLDGNSKDYAYIYETLKNRTKEIIFKYDLPNKSQWE